MNNDPKFIPIHMRAKMTGRKYAFCGNCVGGGTAYENNWCIKHKNAPVGQRLVGSDYTKAVCLQWEPAKPGGSFEQSRPI